MTTEPRHPITPLELRLYVAALLAAVYAISWRVIEGHHVGEPVATPPPRQVVWIDRLPPPKRPAIALPAGWQLASEPRTTNPVVRVPNRVPRVRTRSS